MKRCPVCSAFAANEATTCFECLYSFEHMVSLEQRKPTDLPENLCTDEQTTYLSEADLPETVADVLPLGSDYLGKGEDDGHVPPDTAARPPLIITIKIDNPEGEVVVASARMDEGV